MKPYQICSNCVMDTSDSQIVFDANGVCDHCRDFKENIAPNWRTDDSGKAEFQSIVEKIKKDGAGRSFDCIMGMSGSGSVLLPGVTLEEGVAVGALSLIRENCRSFGIYAGTPARLVGERKHDLLLLEKSLLAQKTK